MRIPILALAVVLTIASELPAQFNAGDIYVTTCDRPAPVFKIDPVSFSVTTFISPTLGCSSPLLFKDSGQLLATDFDANTVISYDTAGNPTTVLGPGDGISGPWAAGGLQKDSQGNIYVNNWAAHQILKFDANFQNGSVFADGSDGLSNVDALEIDAGNNFYCGSRNMGTVVLKIDPAGNASTFDNLPAGEVPSGISYRKNGDLYVATNVGNIYRYPGGSAAGRVLLTNVGVSGVLMGTAFDPTSTVLYVTAISNGSLYTVDPDTGSTSLVVNGGLGSVYGIEVFDDCTATAGWSNYGAGFPGTNGVPTITANAPPIIGTTASIACSNSLGSPTTAVLLIGLNAINIPGSWGGDLLVLPTIVVVLNMPMGGSTVNFPIPPNLLLCGVDVFLQCIEVDPGAANGLSSTDGLNLSLGY